MEYPVADSLEADGDSVALGDSLDHVLDESPGRAPHGLLFPFLLGLDPNRDDLLSNLPVLGDLELDKGGEGQRQGPEGPSDLDLLSQVMMMVMRELELQLDFLQRTLDELLADHGHGSPLLLLLLLSQKRMEGSKRHFWIFLNDRNNAFEQRKVSEHLGKWHITSTRSTQSLR
jgi:hypothetical protein